MNLEQFIYTSYNGEDAIVSVGGVIVWEQSLSLPDTRLDAMIFAAKLRNTFRRFLKGEATP